MVTPQLVVWRLFLVCWVSTVSCTSTRRLQSRNLHQSNKKEPTTPPDYSLYLKKDQILQKVQDIAQQNPNVAKWERISKKSQNYTADLDVVTLEPEGLTQSGDKKLRLLISFGQHGREYITSEVALALLEALTSPDLLARYVPEQTESTHLQWLLSRAVFTLIPMENVNGRAKVEGGDYCYRKNGRGVDINRNWDVDWGKKEKDYDPYEEYPGTAPFSEPEAQVVLSLAKKFKPHVWLNVHSGMDALFSPYDHRGEIPSGPGAAASIQILNEINRKIFGGKCEVGSGGKTVGYLAHGTATDYMWEILKVPAAFTWEIYGDHHAGYHDCFKMFNPIRKDVFDDVVNKWVRAVLKLVQLLSSHPSMPRLAVPTPETAGAELQEQGTVTVSLPSSPVVPAAQPQQQEAEDLSSAQQQAAQQRQQQQEQSPAGVPSKGKATSTSFPLVSSLVQAVTKTTPGTAGTAVAPEQVVEVVVMPVAPAPPDRQVLWMLVTVLSLVLCCPFVLSWARSSSFTRRFGRRQRTGIMGPGLV